MNPPRSEPTFRYCIEGDCDGKVSYETTTEMKQAMTLVDGEQKMCCPECEGPVATPRQAEAISDEAGVIVAQKANNDPENGF